MKPLSVLNMVEVEVFFRNVNSTSETILEYHMSNALYTSAACSVNDKRDLIFPFQAMLSLH